jgi:hypothetical protein
MKIFKYLRFENNKYDESWLDSVNKQSISSIFSYEKLSKYTIVLIKSVKSKIVGEYLRT